MVSCSALKVATKNLQLPINTKMGCRSEDRAPNPLLRVFDADSGFKLTKIGSEINYKVKRAMSFHEENQ